MIAPFNTEISALQWALRWEWPLISLAGRPGLNDGCRRSRRSHRGAISIHVFSWHQANRYRQRFNYSWSSGCTSAPFFHRTSFFRLRFPTSLMSGTHRSQARSPWSTFHCRATWTYVLWSRRSFFPYIKEIAVNLLSFCDKGVVPVP